MSESYGSPKSNEVKEQFETKKYFNAEINEKKYFSTDSFNDLEKIRQIGKSEKIYAGDCIQLKNDGIDAFYAYDSENDIIGVIKTKDNNCYIIRSEKFDPNQIDMPSPNQKDIFSTDQIDIFSPDQIDIIKDAKKGMVGGCVDLLCKYHEKFCELNIEVVIPPHENCSFNLVLLKKDDDVNIKPPGTYYFYKTPAVYVPTE